MMICTDLIQVHFIFGWRASLTCKYPLTLWGGGGGGHRSIRKSLHPSLSCDCLSNCWSLASLSPPPLTVYSCSLAFNSSASPLGSISRPDWWWWWLYGLTSKFCCRLHLYWKWYCVINLFSVPRILFDQWTLNDYHVIFSSDSALQSLVDTIVSFLKVSYCKVCLVSCCP